MTVAYPLKKQSDYTELRYSLRSLEMFLKKSFEVLIIGETLPEWIDNVTWIDVGDISGKKQMTIKTKIMAALEYSKEVFVFNDDIYLLHEIDPKKFPYYRTSKYRLDKVGEAGAKTLYNQLTAQNKPVKFFDNHYPIVYNKVDFETTMCLYSSDTIIKSAYCNFLELEGVDVPDCKLMNEKKPEQIMRFIKDKPCFSTGTNSLQSAKPVLQKLFPEKSKFEL